MENKFSIFISRFAAMTLIFALGACLLVTDDSGDEFDPAALLAAASSSAAAGGSSGDSGTTASTPSGKRIFATAALYDGNLGGISGADAKCASDANKPSTGTYKAMLSDNASRMPTGTPCTIASCASNTGQADWVLAANTTYLRADDDATIMTTNALALYPLDGCSGSNCLTNAFSTLSGSIWTGFDTRWFPDAPNCTTFNSNSAAGNVRAAVLGQTDGTALYDGTVDACNLTRRLLCVEQ